MVQHPEECFIYVCGELNIYNSAQKASSNITIITWSHLKFDSTGYSFSKAGDSKSMKGFPL